MPMAIFDLPVGVTLRLLRHHWDRYYGNIAEDDSIAVIAPQQNYIYNVKQSA